MLLKRGHPGKIALYALLTILAIGMLVGYSIGYDKIARKVNNYLFGATVVTDWSDGETIFPEVNTAHASDVRKKILLLAEQEFLEQPAGTKNSGGANEAWCANFVSWIMKEAGEPLVNPHSGGWRIPGTYTLYDYYVAEGRFHPVESGYEPKLGDVAIYRNSPVFGDHANIVLLNEDGVLTTVGGNEGGRIRVYKNTEKNYDELLGYGAIGSD